MTLLDPRSVPNITKLRELSKVTGPYAVAIGCRRDVCTRPATCRPGNPRDLASRTEPSPHFCRPLVSPIWRHDTEKRCPDRARHSKCRRLPRNERKMQLRHLDLDRP